MAGIRSYRERRPARAMVQAQEVVVVAQAAQAQAVVAVAQARAMVQAQAVVVVGAAVAGAAVAGAAVAGALLRAEAEPPRPLVGPSHTGYRTLPQAQERRCHTGRKRPADRPRRKSRI